MWRVKFAARLLLVATAAFSADAPIVVNGGDNERLGTLRMTIAQNGNDRWPAVVTITLEQGDKRWPVELDARTSMKPHIYRLAGGDYKLTIAAPHYRTISESITVGTGELDLKTRTLVRNPVVRGVVRTKSGEPLVGALVAPQPGKSSAKTDAIGAFAVEIDEEWPESMQISYPGLATRLVEVPPAERDTTLDAVTLSAGARVVLHITGATAKTAGLFRIIDPMSRKEIANAAVKAGDVVFEDVDAGDYLAILEGELPLQRYAMSVKVEDSAKIERTIELEPLPLTVHIARGENALRASVKIINFEHRWSGTLSTDDAGDAGAEMWQQGKYIFLVQHTPEAPPFFKLDDVEGTDGARITLQLPDRTIRGRILDSSTGSPIPGATLWVNSENDDGTGSSLEATTDAQGHFAIFSLLPGKHTLTAKNDSHLESEPVVIRMVEQDRMREVNFSLRGGRERRVEVVAQDGLPFREASLIHTVDGRVDRIYTTDDRGSVAVRTADSGSVIYVLPREGSFAVVRFTSGTPDVARVVVPDPNASLFLRAVDDRGKPIRDVRFLVRYDGEIIPPDVLSYFDRIRGIAFRTKNDGTAVLEHVPTGMFELWPMATNAEAFDIAAASGNAPVQVSAKPGTNEATLTFRRR